MMMMNQSLSSNRSLQQQGDLNWVLENSSSWNNSAISSNSGLSSSRAPPVARNLMSSSHNAAVGYLDYTSDTGLAPSSSQNNLLLNPLAVSDHHPAAASDQQAKPYISPNHWLLLNGASASTSSMATYYTSASRPVYYNSTANYNSIPNSNSASLMEAQQFQHSNYHSAGYPANLSFEHQVMTGEISNKRDSSYGDGFYGRIGLDLGGRTYFSTAEDMLAVRLGKRPRAGSPLPVPMCQAQGCRADLSTAKHYHRRHKVCEMHSKASTVTANGQTQRFCQQCSRFHALSEFDEGKRSCRKRLADHNRRRRKPQPNAAGPSSSSTPVEESSSPPKEGDSGGEDSSKPHNSSSSAGKEAHNNSPLDLTLI